MYVFELGIGFVGSCGGGNGRAVSQMGTRCAVKKEEKESISAIRSPPIQLPQKYYVNGGWPAPVYFSFQLSMGCAGIWDGKKE